MITWAQELPTSSGEPYLKRWVFDFGLFAIRLHHWLCSDDERAPHDHPYWLVTCVLSGGYTDMAFYNASSSHERPTDMEIIIGEHRGPGSIRKWPALHTHWVKVDKGGCWSLCLTGRQSRVWGFWTERWDKVRRFERSSRYFRKHGHHVCDRP